MKSLDFCQQSLFVSRYCYRATGFAETVNLALAKIRTTAITKLSFFDHDRLTGGAGFFSTGLISENLGAFHKNKALNLNRLTFPALRH